MVVDKASILNIMGGMESTAGVRLHNHRRKLRQRFDIIKKLGQGTYGKVQLGINKETGQEVAIKTIKKSKIESEADLVRIRREIQIMSSVQHPNIIHIYEVFENREKMVLVMEYAAGGELYDFLSKQKVLSQEEARRLFRQISTAVYYCHKHKICHRDLKLENILLDENGNAKIADFGLSNVFDETRLLGTYCGSPLYASPEIVQGTPYHGPEVDCWSLGVLLYTLVYGAMPFDGSNFKRLVKQISQGDYFEPKQPSTASSLIRAMLTVRPKTRADIVKICSHWWVNEGYDESCLDIAEHLANQTPVRLDLLLSLAPPMSADKVVVTKDQEDNGEVAGSLPMAEGPVRSHSVGSLMELDEPSAKRRIRDFINSTKTEDSARGAADKSEATKRKLEEGISVEDTSVGGAKRKERSRSKPERRSSSRSRKNAVSMDTDPDTHPRTRSASEEHILAVAAAMVQNLEEDEATPAEAEDHPEKTEEKKKSVKSVSKKKPESEAIEASLAEEVAEGLSGNEPIRGAAIPPENVAVEQEKTKGKIKRKKKVEQESKTDLPTFPVVDKLSDASPSDESVKSSQSSEPSVEEVKGDVNGDDTSEGLVSIISSSTAPISSLAMSDTAADMVGLDKAKSQGGISLRKISSPPPEVPVAVPVPDTPEEVSPPRSTERRKSKIFETAEKFNNLANTERKSSIVEKPKRIHIPGVKVSDAKAAFERKSSITASPTTEAVNVERKGSISSLPAGIKNSVSKKTVQEEKKESSMDKKPASSTATKGKSTSSVSNEVQESALTEKTQPEEKMLDSSESPQEDETSARMKKVKDAVEVISNAIGDQVSGRKLSLKRPPKLLSFDGSKPGSPAPSTPLSPPGVDPSTGLKTVKVQVAPNDIRLATIQVSTPQTTKYPDKEPPLGLSSSQASEDKGDDSEDTPKKAASKMEITLKSATLPRRKTSKAEIQMGVPPPVKTSPERQIKAAPSPGRRASVGQPMGGYRSEVEHLVGGTDYPNRPRHQRSEVSFPVAAASSNTRPHPMPFRSASCEPEAMRPKPREHIIPIRLEGDDNVAPRTATPPAKPPVPPTTSASASGNIPYQRTLSQRSSSLSRQSTQDSDTESTISQSGGEPIRKSPREYIIPIAVEGGGYVTPRATSLEPSEDNSRSSNTSLPRSRFGRTKRMSSLLSESEDERESPFATLHRHSSIGRDSDSEDMHLHRLRSSRPAPRSLDHADSLSSAEEEDDDEGFELLTAENLFSSLLSRVRSLTQRLNVEDGGRPGFPSSRLLSHFGTAGQRGSPFMFPGSMLSRGSPFEPLSRLRDTGTHRTITTTYTRISESSRSFNRNDSDSGSTGPTPWRRSVSRDVSDSDSIFSESHNSGPLPRGRSSGDFSDASTLSSYSYTPSLAARRAQQQAGGADEAQSQSQSQTPANTTSSTPDRRTPRLSSTPSRRYSSQSSYSSARRAARALEEELNGALDGAGATSYSSSPANASISTRTNEDLSSLSVPNATRRLGRTLSMRERSASPASRREYYVPSSRAGLGVMDSSSDSIRSSRHIRHGLGSSENSDYLQSWERPSTLTRRRPYTSSMSDSVSTADYRSLNPYGITEKDLPPLPSALSRRVSRDSYKLPESTPERRRQNSNDDDCNYYEILPYQKKETADDVLTRSCPPSGFLPDNKESCSTRCLSPKPTVGPSLKGPVPEKEETSSTLPRTYRSISVTRELKKPSDFRLDSNEFLSSTPTSARRVSASTRTTPDRSILSKFFRHSDSDVKQLDSDSASESGEKKSKARRISRFLRPDFFDTPREESVYVKEKEQQKAEEKNKMTNDGEKSPVDKEKTSSRFLKSLEKKLEKLRVGSDAPKERPCASVDSSSSRIESTIRSLREHSLGPKESEVLPTESALLKRAVSVTDCSTAENQSSRRIGGKVFGLFRKTADSDKRSELNTNPSGEKVIPVFKRSQKSYTGARSDSCVSQNSSLAEAAKSYVGNHYPVGSESKTLLENSSYKAPSVDPSNKSCSSTQKVDNQLSLKENISPAKVSLVANVSEADKSPVINQDIKSESPLNVDVLAKSPSKKKVVKRVSSGKSLAKKKSTESNLVSHLTNGQLESETKSLADSDCRLQGNTPKEGGVKSSSSFTKITSSLKEKEVISSKSKTKVPKLPCPGETTGKILEPSPSIPKENVTSESNDLCNTKAKEVKFANKLEPKNKSTETSLSEKSNTDECSKLKESPLENYSESTIIIKKRERKTKEETPSKSTLDESKIEDSTKLTLKIKKIEPASSEGDLIKKVGPGELKNETVLKEMDPEIPSKTSVPVKSNVKEGCSVESSAKSKPVKEIRKDDSLGCIIKMNVKENANKDRVDSFTKLRSKENGDDQRKGSPTKQTGQETVSELKIKNKDSKFDDGTLSASKSNDFKEKDKVENRSNESPTKAVIRSGSKVDLKTEAISTPQRRYSTKSKEEKSDRLIVKSDSKSKVSTSNETERRTTLSPIKSVCKTNGSKDEAKTERINSISPTKFVSKKKDTEVEINCESRDSCSPTKLPPKSKDRSAAGSPTKKDKTIRSTTRSPTKSLAQPLDVKDTSPTKKRLVNSPSNPSIVTKNSVAPEEPRKTELPRALSRSPPKCVQKTILPTQSTKQVGIPRRMTLSQQGALRRSSSHSRSTPGTSSAGSFGRRNSSGPSDIPVVSLKDVERRHRAMLMDKWSQSLQSLHTEKKGKEGDKDSCSVIQPTGANAGAVGEQSREALLTATILTSEQTPQNCSAPLGKIPVRSAPKASQVNAHGQADTESHSANGETSHKSEEPLLRIPCVDGSSRESDGTGNSEVGTTVDFAKLQGCKPRPSLHLDLLPQTSPARLRRRSTDPFNEESILSPTESESVDSWSVCSGDYADVRDWTALSPHSPEDTESVSDRIRRKSFYSRFNDIKKKKKPSSLSLSNSASGSFYGLGSRSRAYPTGYKSSSSAGSSIAPTYSEKPRRSMSLLVTTQSPEENLLFPPYTSRRSGRTSPLSISPEQRNRHSSSIKSLLHNGSSDNSVLAFCPADKSPSWERSGMEIKNDILFHNLGLHRFDPKNLSTNKETLFETLGPSGLNSNATKSLSQSSSSTTASTEPVVNTTGDAVAPSDADAAVPGTSTLQEV